MLAHHEAIANLAVKDLETARGFYEDTLGLQQVGAEGDEVLVFQAGASQLFVYRSEFAGTNQATALSWVVGDAIDEEVRALAAKGVRFEHYPDMPGMHLEGDLHVAEGMKVAWFKDPDGNILSLVTG